MKRIKHITKDQNKVNKNNKQKMLKCRNSCELTAAAGKSNYKITQIKRESLQDK